MSSPFRIFRKYQKSLLVVAGVVLMFVFVIGDSLMSYIGGATSGPQTVGGRPPTATAVSWSGGSLSNRELENLVYRRRVVKGFLEQIVQYGYQEATQNRESRPLPLNVELVARIDRPEQGVERDVVQTKLLADAARQAGMQVTDDNIRHYLAELGRGRVPTDVMRAIIKRMGSGGGGPSIDYVFNALREELLARNFVASFQFAFETVMPAQRFDDWLRVNDRIVVEAAAVPARQFVVDVPAPSDTELAAFFAQYAEREPRPEMVDNTELPSPTPGFATPRQLKSQFLVADFNKFIPKVAEEVTDQEIEEYYEQFKETDFVKADTRVFESALPETELDAESDDDQSQSDDAQAPADDEIEVRGQDPDAEPENAESDQPAPETEPGPSNEPAGSQTAEEESADVDTAVVDTAGNESAGNESAGPDGTGSDGILDGDSIADDDLPGQRGAAAEADTTASGAGSLGDQAPVSATEDSATENSATENSALENDQPATDPPREYQPLDEVRDTIRTRLAEQKTGERLTELISELQGNLNTIHTEWLAKVLDADPEDPPLPPPAELADLSTVVGESGLEFQQTPLASFFDFRDTPLGSSLEREKFQAPLAQVLFARDDRGQDVVELYEPLSSYDRDGNQYLALKVEDIDRQVPKLDEIREDVVRAWKLQQAAEKALARAEELAQEAEKGAVPLAEFFANDAAVEVVTTDLFSWLSIGSVSQTTGQVFFRLGTPEGIVAAGPAFMSKAFLLGEGEVGAVLNHDRSIAYVVRVAEHQETSEDLRQAFLSEADRWFGLTSMTRFHALQSAQAFREDLLASLGVEWQRDPDQVLVQ